MGHFYRRTPHRLPADAYRRPGVFLVTIVLHERRSILGRIDSGLVTLSSQGEIVRTCLLEIPRHWPEIRVDEWVVMPDHLHAILVVDRPLPAGLAQVIGGFKAATTKRLNALPFRVPSPFWQKSFHDRRICTDEALSAARRYIAANPAKWPG